MSTRKGDGGGLGIFHVSTDSIAFKTIDLLFIFADEVGGEVTKLVIFC